VGRGDGDKRGMITRKVIVTGSGCDDERHGNDSITSLNARRKSPPSLPINRANSLPVLAGLVVVLVV
jgi:hypothetical protein